MANISADITELRQILDFTPASHNIMLVGNHGIGKSMFLTEYYQEKGMKVVPLFLGQMADPGDLIGLPHKNEKNGITEFMAPYWWPVDGKPIVLFLDELNRARPEILQTVMDLCLNRTLAGKKLPEGSRVIAGINYGDQYQLTDLDIALVSRFNIINFKPTVEEWLLWADKNNVDSRVMEFIQDNHIWLDKNADSKEGEDTGVDKTPDRRAWKRVSDIIYGRDTLSAIDTKIISSIVGPKATSAFLASISAHKILSAKDVLYHFDKNIDKLKKYQLHDLSVVNESIFRYLEVEKAMQKNKETVKGNIDKYFDFLCKERKEGAAHFANTYVGGTYPNAVAFLAKECPFLTMGMIAYVQSIK